MSLLQDKSLHYEKKGELEQYHSFYYAALYAIALIASAAKQAASTALAQRNARRRNMRVSVQLQRLIQKPGEARGIAGHAALLDVQASKCLDRQEHFSCHV